MTDIASVLEDGFDESEAPFAAVVPAVSAIWDWNFSPGFLMATLLPALANEKIGAPVWTSIIAPSGV